MGKEFRHLTEFKNRQKVQILNKKGRRKSKASKTVLMREIENQSIKSELLLDVVSHEETGIGRVLGNKRVCW